MQQGLYDLNNNPIKGLKVYTEDGHNFILLESFKYIRKDGFEIYFPEKMESDGASTPRGMWNILPPFGSYWIAAFVHDGLYRGVATVLGLVATKDYCDKTFLEVMQFLNVSEFEEEPMYHGVHLLGWHSFNEDREDIMKDVTTI